MAATEPSRDAPRRILVGLGETAGYCARLVEGLRGIGVAADHVNLGDDPMGYGDDRWPRRVRIARWLGERRRSRRGPRAMWVALHRMAMVWLFLDAARRYDTFILRAGDSFLGMRDYALLRRLGKTLIVVFFGSDSRPSYLNGAEIRAGQDGATAAATTAAKRRMVARTERHATHIVCHALSAQLHRRPFVAFLEMGIPRRIPASWASLARRSGPVRLLHAPSRPHDKGTEQVRAAVDDVRRSGLDVELTVVTGVSNAEVQRAITDADAVVDQPYSDTPMAALAAEAAALGRPAIVGGYGWEELGAMGDPERLPPSERCHPDDLARAIRHVASDAAHREALGERARRFLEERWTPERVAERYVALARGEAPSGWMVDPIRVDYALGVGAPAAEIREAVRRVLAAAGPAGLAVDDKPHLVERLLALVGQVSAP